jgi:hydroxymethylbilane synthase
VIALDPALEVELVLVQTTGDVRTDVPLHAIGGQGVFVKEVQHAVLDGRADLAVHSAKDLPSIQADGLVLACVPERADARDALVGAPLAALAPGATVATGSVRRQAQLAHHRPDLQFVDLRGNVPTRLEKVPPGGAVVVAVAGVERLGLAHRIAEVLDPAIVLPQVGQGALAVECRAGDEAALAQLARLEHEPSRRAVDAERAFLTAIGGGCDLPVGAYATVAGNGRDLHLTGVLATVDGARLVRHEADGADAVALGEAVAAAVLADGQDLLDRGNARPR